MASSKLWLATLLALFFCGAGCTQRSLTYEPDGGTGSDGGSACSRRSTADCESDTRCVVQAGCCNGPSLCVPEGTTPPVCHCPVGCQGLDESACIAEGATCVADYCFECSCTATFIACRAPSDPQTMCPLSNCAQPDCQCQGLDESECISGEQSLGCQPQYCPDCHGGQTFSECLGAGSGGGACPDLCPVETCHDQSECTGGEECVAPGQPAGCGICNPDGCVDDGGCANGEVCEVTDCSCTASGKSCVDSCLDAGCPDGQTCAANGHCLAIPCSGSGQCPSFFSCVSQSCQRSSCASDGACPGGFCVDALCYSTLGSCTIPPP